MIANATGASAELHYDGVRGLRTVEITSVGILPPVASDTTNEGGLATWNDLTRGESTE